VSDDADRMIYLLERILEELESLRLSIEFTTEDDPKEDA